MGLAFLQRCFHAYYYAVIFITLKHHTDKVRGSFASLSGAACLACLSEAPGPALLAPPRPVERGGGAVQSGRERCRSATGTHTNRAHVPRRL